MESVQGGPTFDDLSIDDDLTQLERVKKYCTSSIALQRLVHAKMLAETVAAVGLEDTKNEIAPLLETLVQDNELVVRQHLGQQLGEIARICREEGTEAGNNFIIETILKRLDDLLKDPHAEVRQAAGESLVGVASEMKRVDLGPHVLTIVLKLAHDDEDEELRMTAAALLNDLAEYLGDDLCKQFVTPEMTSLSEDPVFRVRKATALNLHKICKVVGDAGIKRLLPAYIKLTTDQVYRVRKACTEALVEMSKAVGPELSKKELIPAFRKLSDDAAKLVRTGALQHLGRLIATLPGEDVGDDLIKRFTSTATTCTGDHEADAALRLYCAFSFPAVVITVGPDRWGELRDSYNELLKDNWSVRKTLSYSLHEIAKVLRAEDVEQDLIPAMEGFLKDHEDVRLGVVRNLAAFFEQLSTEQRKDRLHVLVEILQTTSPFNWRLREVLAQQLPRLAPLLSPDIVFLNVVPVAFGLLNDPVAVVREKTFEVVAPLLQLAGEHSTNRKTSMVARIRELAHASTYQARQMYVYICHSMACSADTPEDRSLFAQVFVPSLAGLAKDSVVNVRIAMSRTLAIFPDWAMELQYIRRAIQALLEDSNEDVRHFVLPLLEFFEEDMANCLDTSPPSSLLGDESMLAQNSDTARSVLNVGDFPRNNSSSSSPSRSFTLERQRSSSIESAGESGNSTTSSEAEDLNRQASLRRPPLPVGWGLSSPFSSPSLSPSLSPSFSPSLSPPFSLSLSQSPSPPAATSGTTAAAAPGSGGSAGGESGDGSGEGGDAIFAPLGGEHSPEYLARGGGGGLLELKPSGMVSVEDGQNEAFFDRGSSENTATSFRLLLSPPKWAASQIEVAAFDGEGDDSEGRGGQSASTPHIVIPHLVEEAPPSSAVSAYVSSLSLDQDTVATLAAVIEREGMPPPIVSLAGGHSPVTAPLGDVDFGRLVGSSPRGVERGLAARLLEERPAVWIGGLDGDDEPVDLKGRRFSAGGGEEESKAWERDGGVEEINGMATRRAGGVSTSEGEVRERGRDGGGDGDGDGSKPEEEGDFFAPEPARLKTGGKLSVSAALEVGELKAGEEIKEACDDDDDDDHDDDHAVVPLCLGEGEEGGGREGGGGGGIADAASAAAASAVAATGAGAGAAVAAVCADAPADAPAACAAASTVDAASFADASAANAAASDDADAASTVAFAATVGAAASADVGASAAATAAVVVAALVAAVDDGAAVGHGRAAAGEGGGARRNDGIDLREGQSSESTKPEGVRGGQDGVWEVGRT